MRPYKVAKQYRDLIPYPPVGDCDIRTKHHACRNDEHIDNRMLEPLLEEHQDRHHIATILPNVDFEVIAITTPA